MYLQVTANTTINNVNAANLMTQVSFIIIPLNKGRKCNMLHVKMREWPELIITIQPSNNVQGYLYQRIVILTVFPETILTGISNGLTENPELEHRMSEHTTKLDATAQDARRRNDAQKSRNWRVRAVVGVSSTNENASSGLGRGGAQRLRGTDVGNFIFIFSCDNRCAQRLPTGKSELSTAECSAMGRPHNTMTELRSQP